MRKITQIITFTLITLNFVIVTSCKNSTPTDHNSSQIRVKTTMENYKIQDTVGAQQVEENIPENTYVPDTSDVFRNSILRQLHIPVEEQIYYQAAEIPYLENRTAVIIIKSDDKTRNTEDFNVYNYVLVVETETGKVLNKYLDTDGSFQSNCSTTYNSFSETIDQEYRADFDFTLVSIFGNNTLIVSSSFIQRGGYSWGDRYVDIYTIYFDTLSKVMNNVLLSTYISVSVSCPDQYPMSEVNGKFRMEADTVQGFRSIIIDYESESTSYIPKKSKHKKHSNDVSNDDCDKIEINNSEKKSFTFKYDRKSHQYFPVDKKGKRYRDFNGVIQEWRGGM